MTANNTKDYGPHGRTIGGILKGALDMEDQISHGVYCDYLDHRNWPATLKEKNFLQIKEYLQILIADTERHTKTIKAIQKKLGL